MVVYIDQVVEEYLLDNLQYERRKEAGHKGSSYPRRKKPVLRKKVESEEEDEEDEEEWQDEDGDNGIRDVEEEEKPLTRTCQGRTMDNTQTSSKKSRPVRVQPLSPCEVTVFITGNQ
ncbi:hypothetical protein BG005_005133 [Podila minutissima]|nr:hypothetical protein BG005_005133 [Podila minutissima]